MNNTWQTSLFRAGIGFLLFFTVGYLLLFVLHQILQKKVSLSSNDKVAEEGKPEFEQEKQLVEGPMDESAFQAIPLQALHSGDHQNPSEEAAAQVTRTWMKENRGDSH